MTKKPTYEELEQRVLELEKANFKRKQPKHAMWESESLLSSIFRAAPTGIGVVSNRILLAVNDRVCDMLGYSREEMIGHNARMLYPSEAHFEYVGTEKYRQILQCGTGTVETLWQCKDGRVIDILMSSAPINPEDLAEGVTFTALDITERKKAEGLLRESEAMQRILLDNLPAGVIIVDPVTRSIETVNDHAASLFGGPIDCLIGQRCHSLLCPVNDGACPICDLGNTVDNSECEILRNDGSRLPVIKTVKRIQLKGQEKLLECFVDVSDRKLAEEDRALNAQRTQALLHLNQMTEATLQEITDFALEEAVRLTKSTIGYLAFLNDDENVLTMHSWSKFAMAACAIADKSIIYPLETTGLWGEAVRQRRPVVTNDYITAGHLKKGCPEGHVAIGRHMNTPVFEGARIVLVAGVGNKAEEYNQDDVQQLTLIMEGMWRLIERKRAEVALRENEEKFRLTFSSSPDAVVISRLDDGLIVDVNEGFTRMTGFTLEDFIGKTYMEIDLWHDLIDRQMLFHGLREKGFYENLEGQFRRKNGSLITGLMSARVISLKGVPHIISIVRDITERKMTEEAIAKERTLSDNIINSLPGIFYMFDDLGKLVRWNRKFEKVAGYSPEELLGMQPTDFFSQEHKSYIALRVLSVFSEGEAFAEAPFLTKEGDRIPYFFTGRLTVIDGKQHLLGVGVDITERLRVEEEKDALQAKLQQAQKFEAIGTLAGGVAHDFNNLLMGIQGRASLLSFDLEPSHPHWEHVNAIEEYIRSATSLTKQLLGFARGGKYEVNPVDMNELVHGSSAMFGRTKKEIRIHTKCQATPLVVEADRGQIEQVLLNMYINAWQAMPPGGGNLYLETKIVTLDEVNCKPHQVEPGRYVKVSITDTGPGMDEATRLRIFDPFYTTKEMGRGTGLGLASAYGIIKNHGGMITVYSEIGHGTTFSIYLPVSDKESHREVPIERGLIKGSASILLVDDEELIIDVGQAMLERLGYRVVVCRGGQEAVKMVTDMGDEIDLVILDMIMPGMDGGTTFDRIHEIQPDMPVILSSGYAINGHAYKIMRRGCNGFIQKPYNFSELSEKIGKVLDKVKGSSHA